MLDDLRAIVMDKGLAKVPDSARTKVGGEQRHGDAAIVLALGYFASRQEIMVYASHQVPRHGRAEIPDDDAGDPTPRLIKRTAGFGLRRGAW